MKVGIAGLGAIGLKVARSIDEGAIPGVMLAAASARDRDKAARNLATFRSPPKLVQNGPRS